MHAGDQSGGDSSTSSDVDSDDNTWIGTITGIKVFDDENGDSSVCHLIL
jgi:hypothetical protein